MIDCAMLRKSGVALLASRICVLGDDPCGGSEVVLWEDARILEKAGIPVRVYARAARKDASVNIISFRTQTAQLNTIEYSRALLRNEPEALILAYNEPALAGYAPDRSIVRFDWMTPLPRYWNWPLWLSRFQRAGAGSWRDVRCARLSAPLGMRSYEAAGAASSSVSVSCPRR